MAWRRSFIAFSRRAISSSSLPVFDSAAEDLDLDRPGIDRGRRGVDGTAGCVRWRCWVAAKPPGTVMVGVGATLMLANRENVAVAGGATDRLRGLLCCSLDGFGWAAARSDRAEP